MQPAIVFHGRRLHAQEVIEARLLDERPDFAFHIVVADDGSAACLLSNSTQKLDAKVEAAVRVDGTDVG